LWAWGPEPTKVDESVLAHRSSEPPAEQQLNHHAEDKGHVVHFDLDVKSWEKSPPGVDACRPARCPCCGVPAAAAGKVTLHGYGLRPRQRWGPADATPQSQGEIRTLLQRRYRCQSCRAVVVVRPRGELAHVRYSAATIAMVLWLWGCAMLTDAAVRSRASPHPSNGVSRPERWPTLRRWARAARDGALWRSVKGDRTWTLRQCAGRAARIITALADAATGPGEGRAFAGARLAR